MENRPGAKQNIMSAVGVTSGGRGTRGREREPEADNKEPRARRERSVFGASPALCECWTVLFPRGAKVSNFSPAATPFLSRLVHPCSHPASPGPLPASLLVLSEAPVGQHARLPKSHRLASMTVLAFLPHHPWVAQEGFSHHPSSQMRTEKVVGSVAGQTSKRRGGYPV